MKYLLYLVVTITVLTVCFAGWLVFEKALFYRDKISADERAFYNEGLRITNPDIIRAANFPHLGVLLGGSLFHYWYNPVDNNWQLVNYGGLEEKTVDTYNKLKMVTTKLIPEFVVINAGFCEIHMTVLRGGDIEKVLERNIEYLHLMTDIAQTHNVEIILTSLLPVRPRYKLPYTGWIEFPTEKKTRENEAIRSFNARVKQLAKEKNVQFIDFHLALANETGQLRKEYALTDGEHLNREGYRALSVFFIRELTRITQNYGKM